MTRMMRASTETPRPRRSGCFRVGCLGCLFVLVAPILVVVVLSLIGRASDVEPRPERQDSEQTIPSAAPELPLEMPDVAGDAMPVPAIPKPGRIVFDVSFAEMRIEAGPPGTSLRLHADYDSARFDLEERFEETDDGQWRYRIDFGPHRGFLGAIGAEANNELILIIPRKSLIALEGTLGVGSHDLELGGLWLSSVDLKLGSGEHEMSFDEALEQPLSELLIDSSFGELDVVRLGNASPAKVRVEHSAGKLWIDLDGAWHGDADIEVDFGFGDCSLSAPADVAVDVERSSVVLGEQVRRGLRDAQELPADAPTLRLSLSGVAGNISVRQ